jgi:hypothetical protein
MGWCFDLQLTAFCTDARGLPALEVRWGIADMRGVRSTLCLQKVRIQHGYLTF